MHFSLGQEGSYYPVSSSKGPTNATTPSMPASLSASMSQGQKVIPVPWALSLAFGSD